MLCRLWTGNHKLHVETRSKLGLSRLPSNGCQREQVQSHFNQKTKKTKSGKCPFDGHKELHEIRRLRSSTIHSRYEFVLRIDLVVAANLPNLLIPQISKCFKPSVGSTALRRTFIILKNLPNEGCRFQIVVFGVSTPSIQWNTIPLSTGQKYACWGIAVLSQTDARRWRNGIRSRHTVKASAYVALSNLSLRA
jgi:hypothetical protein